MKFMKVSENSIRCIITQEEMFAKGINIDDLMDDRSKAEEFLHDILNEAKEELNFETSGDALNVQLSILKDGNISLMISDDKNSNMRAMLEQIKDKLKNFQENHEAETVNTAADDDKQTVLRQKNEELVKNASENDPLEMVPWAEFADMNQCILLAKQLKLYENMPSVLYKRDQSYYLKFDLIFNRKDMAQAIFIISEYSRCIYPSALDMLGVEEHGEILLSKDAISILAQL